jgi:AGZA family xanthine/uracil permease-like MFS transporter
LLDKQGKLPRLRRALFPDALCTTLAGLLGSSACAIYIESASGIAAGGRKGITAITVGALFLLTLFFEPLASSIPLFAVTAVLVIIGALMLQSVIDLNWKDPTEFIPAFVTVVGIPLTYSVGTGIGLGMILFPICKLFAGKWRDVHWLSWILAALFAWQFAEM